jgi:hypothetical protein
MLHINGYMFDWQRHMLGDNHKFPSTGGQVFQIQSQTWQAIFPTSASPVSRNRLPRRLLYILAVRFSVCAEWFHNRPIKLGRCGTGHHGPSLSIACTCIIVYKIDGSDIYQNHSQLSVKMHYYYYLKNSLIIHEENTKKNHKRVVSVYTDSCWFT